MICPYTPQENEAMTRFKLIPWLAIPALLLLGPMMPTATAAIPKESIQDQDGLIFFPLDEVSRTESVSRLATSAAGQVTVAQYGTPDGAIANRNRFLAVRFDLPYTGSYTITGISFASRTQNARLDTLAGGALKFPASFRSVRILGHDCNTGLPDKSQTLFRTNRYLGSSSGGTNNIALSLVVNNPTILYAVFEFPAPTSGVADTFPFLLTDRLFTEQGLYANDFALDTTAAVAFPEQPGTLPGTGLLVDQNLAVSMSIQLTGQAPMNALSGLGCNLRSAQAEFGYTVPANELSDGTPAPRDNFLRSLQLVRRTNCGWVAEGAIVGVPPDRIVLTTVDPGVQIWGAYGIDKDGNHTLVGNVTITGASAVVGATAGVGEDADEANGNNNISEATQLIPIVSDRPESIWPAGDQDYFYVYAHPGDIISVNAKPTSIDFRNDLDPVVQVFANNGDLLATGVAASPGEQASAVVAAAGNGNGLKPYMILVTDRSGSLLDPADAPRVLIPASYNLDVDVETPAVLSHFGPSAAPISSLLNPDQFAFANAGANPVRGGIASFGYVIPRSLTGGVPVKLRIYDVRGRLVSTLVNESIKAGTHFASWSGYDVRGNRMSPGAYFARIEAGSWSRTIHVDLVN
jgi:hypothetical protein